MGKISIEPPAMMKALGVPSIGVEITTEKDVVTFMFTGDGSTLCFQCNVSEAPHVANLLQREMHTPTSDIVGLAADAVRGHPLSHVAVNLDRQEELRLMVQDMIKGKVLSMA